MTGVADMVMDPTNPNKLVVAMWEHRRTPWDFVSGGKGSGLYLTYDAGETWKKITEKEGMPKGELGRMGIAIAPSMPNLIYALVEAKENGLYVSEDGGENWSLVSKKNIGNRPFYYAELYVDPQNENRIYNLWSYVSRSEDGGKTFETIMDYGNDIHPDHHAFWIDPSDPSYLIDGNDGGLTISRDRGESWQFVNNLPIGQFYHVNVDDDFPYNVYGGMQDNGSWVGPGFVLKSGGIRNYDWQELYFGDGFDVAPDPKDNRFGYAMSQGGNIAYYDRETGRTEAIKPLHLDDDMRLRYNWNAALALDPHQDCGLYFASQFVHYSKDCGKSWKIISPDLTTNDPMKQKQDVSGGLTIDATNAENHTTILCIAPSTQDKETLWVGTDDGNLQITRDGGESWKNLSRKLSGLPAGSWIPQIRLSPNNEGEAFVVANNFRRNDFSAYAYHTTNYGGNWNRIAGDDQVKGFVTSIIQDPEEENLLFLGTDVGLYYSLNKGGKWTRWDIGFPHVQVRDLAFQDRFDDLVIGTFGRAFWVLDEVEVLRDLAREGERVLQKEFKVFTAADAYMTSRRSYDGIRFIAQGDFVGENKRVGPRFNYWVKPKLEKGGIENKGIEKAGEESDEKDKGDAKDDKIRVAILNVNGDTLRQYSRKAEEGLQSISWNGRRDGIRFPSKTKAKKEDDLPSGYSVLPGKYKAVFSYKGMKDSTEFLLNSDPRLSTNIKDMEAIHAVYEDHYKNVEKATDALDQVMEAKESLALVESLLKTKEDSTSTAQLKELKLLKKGLTELEDLYMMPSGLKGIQRDPKRLTNVIWTTNRYVGSSWTKPGGNAMRAFRKSEAAIEKTVTQIDAFFEEQWNPFRLAIEERNLSPFKE